MLLTLIVLATQSVWSFYCLVQRLQLEPLQINSVLREMIAVIEQEECQGSCAGVSFDNAFCRSGWVFVLFATFHLLAFKIRSDVLMLASAISVWMPCFSP